MESTLLESVRAFGQAWARGDIPALQALLAPGYIHTDFEGRLFQRDEWLESPSLRGTAARCRFTILSPFTIRFTQVWLHLYGRWQRLAFQATRVIAK